jgi:DNA-binding IclR family transcriptional regulator
VTHLDSLPSIPSAAVFSFLKDTRGALTWTAHDLAEALKLSRQDANKILTVLQLQGYVHQNSGSQQWLTTASGEIVSGSTLPRLSRESVEQAVATLAALRRSIETQERSSK